MKSWICLLIAIIFGVLGTLCLKLSHGLARWKPTVSLFILYSISFVALTLTLQGIEISIVYAIWSGIGTILIAIIGMVAFKETLSLQKVFSLALIVLGVIGIHLVNAYHSF